MSRATLSLRTTPNLRMDLTPRTTRMSRMSHELRVILELTMSRQSRTSLQLMMSPEMKTIQKLQTRFPIVLAQTAPAHRLRCREICYEGIGSAGYLEDRRRSV